MNGPTRQVSYRIDEEAAKRMKAATVEEAVRQIVFVNAPGYHDVLAERMVGRGASHARQGHCIKVPANEKNANKNTRKRDKNSAIFARSATIFYGSPALRGLRFVTEVE